MMGLWADGWFYISSAGFLVSGVLFFFLLGQYRAASAAADATESDPPEIAVSAVHPVFVPDEPAHAPVASISPVVKAAEAKAPEKDTTVTGGIRGVLTLDLETSVRAASISRSYSSRVR